MEGRTAEGLSATQLKYIAALFMVIDHWNHIFLPLSGLAAASPTWSNLFYYVGRAAFPIFAFFVAEGCRKTRDFPHYLLRLGLFALITQLPFLGPFRGQGGSIIPTFFLASLAVYLAQRMASLGPGRWLAVLPCAWLAHWMQSDYSWMGVLTVAAVYLAGETHRNQLLMLGLCTSFLYLVQLPAQALVTYWLPAGEALLPALAQALPSFLRTWLPYYLLSAAGALAALPLLAWYSGARGNGSKWFFYWFYPAHMVVIWGLHFLFSTYLT
ncbi:conjugal transfer protein TraX [Pseudoflavonifractor sp. 524-17]|uniref:TraX family protein n=1 Tax=Pseudoflavonifractor sp. 524-17 TaxID=2304577 RepID=UPI0013796D84|nr:TraX family protein [Pseudoflavonifractor sp. 524-17]NCE65375.1 conjugal transfer protein TraX [Pseudoflavonifractor sp. 524-17]